MVTNINGIKDVLTTVHNATLTDGELSAYVDKSIRDITFADGKAYVAMGYGFAVIDESTFSVIRSVAMRTNVCVNSVAKVGDKLLILSNSTCYYGDPDANDPINTYAKLRHVHRSQDVPD